MCLSSTLKDKVFVVCLLTLLTSGAYSQTPRDQLNGFGNARFGMTEAQMKSQFPDAISFGSPPPPEKINERWLRRKTTVEGIGQVNVQYRLGHPEARLVEIYVSRPFDNSAMTRVECQAIFSRYIEVLENRYGKADAMPNSRDGRTGNLLIWSFRNGSAIELEGKYNPRVPPFPIPDWIETCPMNIRYHAKFSAPKPAERL